MYTWSTKFLKMEGLFHFLFMYKFSNLVRKNLGK
jgi:hypothetical protein